MKPEYDVVVVGAGPAGSTAARLIAAQGHSVALLEKDREVGVPVRCGEAVSNRSLETIVPLDPRWIASEIRRFRLVAPNGSWIEPDIGGHGYVLERKLFDADLARMAAESGAELFTKSWVTGLLPSESGPGWAGVRLEHKGQTRQIRARVIVGADGVESRIGAWAGIDTTTRIEDMESCAQMTLTDIDLEPDTCVFYFGHDIAPMGYLWVFPKGRRTANVGIGISAKAGRSRSALSYLRAFVERTYPRSGVLTMIAGGVPCAPAVDPLFRENVVLVGDAAHQVNPISGGGITSGMQGAVHAATCINEALASNSLASFARYPTLWDKSHGQKHRTYHRMKQAVFTFPDEALNGIADKVMSLPEEKRTLWNVFRAALTKRPQLIWEMVKTFGLSS